MLLYKGIYQKFNCSKGIIVLFDDPIYNAILNIAKKYQKNSSDTSILNVIKSVKEIAYNFNTDFSFYALNFGINSKDEFTIDNENIDINDYSKRFGVQFFKNTDNAFEIRVVEYTI